MKYTINYMKIYLCVVLNKNKNIIKNKYKYKNKNIKLLKLSKKNTMNEV